MAVLLQQMENMLVHWDSVGGGNSSNGFESGKQQLELARAALGLFVSGSGVFRPLLQKLISFVFRFVDDLVAERAVLEQKHAGLHEAVALREAASAPAVDSAVFENLREKDNAMQILARTAAIQRDALLAELAGLREEKEHLEQLLAHQMMRHQQGSVVEGDIRVLVRRADAEKQADDLSKRLASTEAELRDVKEQLATVRELNAKFSAQALELSARLSVLLEHNHRCSVALSSQQSDLLRAEKECEVAKTELADALRANRLLRGALDCRGEVEQRESFLGLGANAIVPKHLHAVDYVRHVTLTKSVAQNLVFDILTAKRGKSGTISAFTAAFLTTRYGADASSYAYALDLACTLYDADVTLEMFGLVSRGRVSEEIFTLVRSEQKVFYDACAAVDAMLYGAPKLSIPFVQVMGILSHMYPNYSSATLEGMWNALDASLTNAGSLYYGTLFPDTDRDMLIGVTEAAAEVSRETAFSLKFKQALVDDVVRTMHLLEDCLLGAPTDLVSLTDALDRLAQLGAAGVAVDSVMRPFLEGVIDSSTSVSLLRLVHVMRVTVCARLGHCMLNPTETPHKDLLDRLTVAWQELTAEAVPTLVYDALIPIPKRPVLYLGRRPIYDEGKLFRDNV